MFRRPSAQSGTVSAALARDRLGVPSVLYFVLAGVAPLTVVAGVVTTAYAATGLTGVPAAFLVAAVVLMVFSVGYVAMARYITNAGAFYAFISRGLGRPLGVGSALIAVVAYNLLQVGLYGALGPSAAQFAADHFGIHHPWWVFALGAWAVVTVLGLVRVEVSSRVLGVLTSIEIVVIVALTVSGLMHPANGHVDFNPLNPVHLTSSGLGAVLAIAVLGYVGFEQSPVFAEEAREPQRTIPVATYLCLGLIAVVYAAGSWAMDVHYGNQVVATAQQQGPGMLFTFGPQFMSNAGQLLFLTSLFAAALAFHNAVWRYMYALGRERVLFGTLGRTGHTGIPKTASLLQSFVGLAAILTTMAFGWDPMLKLFFWSGTTGGFGIMVLLALTSFSIVLFFARNPRGEPAWRRLVAPGVSALVLTVMVWLCVDNYATLLGVPNGSRASTYLPATYAVVGVLGIAWALILRIRRRAVYEVIGLGADAALGQRAAMTNAPTQSVALPIEGTTR